ncbi:MAG: phage holin family protein [Myxococcota bacterium]
MDLDDDTVGELALRVADSLADQASLHVELVKAELARDASALAKNVAPLAAAVPLFAIGYVFACVAAALALAPLISTAGGLGVVALANLIAAGVAVKVSLTRLRAKPVVEVTVARELDTSATTLVAALRPSPPAPTASTLTASTPTEVPPAR